MVLAALNLIYLVLRVTVVGDKIMLPRILSSSRSDGERVIVPFVFI